MKVKELIEGLQEMDPEAEVIHAMDAEGNGYEPIEDLSGGYMFLGRGDGIAFKKLDRALRSLGYSEADVWDRKAYPDAIDCVVLFP